MKKTILLAVVLLSSGLQMAAKDRDLIGMSNFRQLSGIPYDTLTPKEKDDVFFMAFRSNLPAQHSAARDLLNNKFKLSKQEWTRLENMARDFGLESVKADFAVKTIGSRAPSVPTQAGAAVQPQAQNIPNPPAGSAPVWQKSGNKKETSVGGLQMGKHRTPEASKAEVVVAQGQSKIETLPQNIENLIDAIVRLDRVIFGSNHLSDQEINDVKLTTLQDINKKTIQNVEQELQSEKAKLEAQKETLKTLITQLTNREIITRLRLEGKMQEGSAEFKNHVKQGEKKASEEIQKMIDNPLQVKGFEGLLRLRDTIEAEVEKLKAALQAKVQQQPQVSLE